MFQSRYTFLNELKVAQLSQLATALGVTSSGRKAAIIQSIGETLVETEGSDLHNVEDKSLEGNRGGSKPVKPMTVAGKIKGEIQRSSPKSILSIDMGIRTLAYAHLTLPDLSPLTPLSTVNPTLAAWRTVTISPPPSSKHLITSPTSALTSKASGPILPSQRESFSPRTYAVHAYTLLKSLLTTDTLSPGPTHLLIEQQRFRSAGSAAVTDWALRVGVFEGMLHAVAETLKRERGLNLRVETVNPKRVVGYWLPDSDSKKGGGTSEAEPARKDGGKRTAREVKKAKINVVARWLKNVGSRARSLPISSLQLAGVATDVQPTVDAYLSKSKSKAKEPRLSTEPKEAMASLSHKNKAATIKGVQLSKLDDLADSLLQAIAWLRWRQTRIRVATLTAVDDQIVEGATLARNDLLAELGIHATNTAAGHTQRKGNVSGSNRAKQTGGKDRRSRGMAKRRNAS